MLEGTKKNYNNLIETNIKNQWTASFVLNDVLCVCGGGGDSAFFFSLFSFISSARSAPCYKLICVSFVLR